jgi:hypothetical protein
MCNIFFRFSLVVIAITLLALLVLPMAFVGWLCAELVE